MTLFYLSLTMSILILSIMDLVIFMYASRLLLFKEQGLVLITNVLSITII